MRTHDAIRNGKFLTLDEQIEALKEYLPDWDGTLKGLAEQAFKRNWEMYLSFDGLCGPEARCDLIDYSGNTPWREDGDEVYPPYIAVGKWGISDEWWLYAAIRAFRKALKVPEYPQTSEENT
jgi:hypothetical protein